MGAKSCPDAGAHYLLNQSCKGALPAHLVRVLLDIPVDSIHVSVEERMALAREAGHFLAIPGEGARPDFIAYFGANSEGESRFVVRSFEGKDEVDTVYAVQGLFLCVDDDAGVDRYELVDVDDCLHAVKEYRLWKREPDAGMQNVTDRYLPRPVMTENEQRRYVAKFPVLDAGNLSAAPVLRWFVPAEIEGGIAASDPRRSADFEAHYGFAVWNGKTFDLRERVPWWLWPPSYCSRWRPPSQYCGNLGERVYDPFVDR